MSSSTKPFDPYAPSTTGMLNSVEQDIINRYRMSKYGTSDKERIEKILKDKQQKRLPFISSLRLKK